MKDVQVRPARRSDCDRLAPLLRHEDVAELTASLGLSPLSALVASWAVSEVTWTVTEGDEVVGLFGVATSPSPGVGVPWFLGSRRLDDLRRAMLVIGRRYIGAMLTMYPILQNYVHHTHTTSFTWLEHLGFTREGTEPRFGVAQERFYLYRLCVTQ